MHNFCFNDCMPQDVGQTEAIKALSDTLREYGNIKAEFPDEVEGIFTSQQPSNISLGSSSLLDIIPLLDHELRRIAYRVFTTKHPIDKFLDQSDDDDLLENEYVIHIGGAFYDAMSAKIATDNDGVLFSLGLHDDLKKNVIDIISSTDSTNIVKVNNLFGEVSNTDYIANLIKKAIHDKLGNFERLLEVVGDNAYSDRFKKGFEKASKPVQDSVIEHFQKAIDRNGPSPFYADGGLVGPTSEQIVFELRIFSPVAYRVYFHEGTDKIYLALMEKKPPKKKQNIHIEAAAKIIRELILTDN